MVNYSPEFELTSYTDYIEIYARAEMNTCEYLEWDSEFFGRRIARITLTSLTREEMGEAMAWCASHSIECIYLLVDTNSIETVRLAEENLFHLVDIRVTLRKQMYDYCVSRGGSLEYVVRPCLLADMPVLKDIAKVSHRDSRFYCDPEFPRSLCDGLYQTWIEKSCAENPDSVLVAEIDGSPVGYVSCRLVNSANGQIGLFAVAEAARGRGLGPRLLAESLRWFAERGVEQVTVVTQGRNDKALRVYQAQGFLLSYMQIWYHRWFSSA